ncbi:hypothetical protein GCM10009626_41530 [Brachybacterium sacelli]
MGAVPEAQSRCADSAGQRPARAELQRCGADARGVRVGGPDVDVDEVSGGQVVLEAFVADGEGAADPAAQVTDNGLEADDLLENAEALVLVGGEVPLAQRSVLERRTSAPGNRAAPGSIWLMRECGSYGPRAGCTIGYAWSPPRS